MFRSLCHRLLLTSFALSLVTSTPAYAGKQLLHDFDQKAFQTNPAAVAKKYVKTDYFRGGTFGKKPSLEGIERIAIVGFEVVFDSEIREKIKGSNWKGVTQGQWANSNWELKIYNFDPSVRQAITNAAYNDLVNHLEEDGFDVLRPEAFEDLSDFQTLVSESQAIAKEESGLVNQGVYNWGKNELYYATVDGLPILERDSKFMAQFKNSKTLTRIGKAIESLHDGKTAAVSAVYRLNTAKLTPTGGLTMGNLFRDKANDTVFSLEVSPSSHLTFYTNLEEGKYITVKHINSFVKKPVQATTSVGKGKFLKENTGTQLLGAGLGMVTRSLTGVSAAPKVTKLRRYELTVDGDAYTEIGTHLLDTTQDLFFEQLNSKN